MYCGYGIASDGRGSARNAIIFDVDSSSSSYADNQKNDFLVLGEIPTFGINRSLVHQKKVSY